jgi:anti-sigma factor RsiW
MSLSKEALLELMAYADGELEGEDAQRVEALLATDEEARTFVASLAPVGEWVARAEEEHAVASGADSIASAVMEKIDAGRRPVSLDDARRKRLRERITWVVAGVVAVAAGVAVYLRSEVPGAAPGPVAVTPPAKAPAPEKATTPNEGHTAVAANTTAPDEEPGVDVDTVESPNEVSVFYVPAVAAAANLNASSVVIWIDETKDPKGK